MPSLFSPQSREEFLLRFEAQEKRFLALEHPTAPGIVHAMKAGKATVYKIRALDAGNHEYALKVMKSKYQDPELEGICDKLDGLKDIPGLTVCERQCLSPSSAQAIIDQYKNLRYAILMPWIQGTSWFDVLVLGKKNGQATLDKERSFGLASSFAAVLSRLEAKGIAHCDLSAGNVMVDPKKLQIELIDVEDVFAPGFGQPKFQPLGTPGYQHRTSSQGQWNAWGDRFAGAILLGEMLGWYDETVRAVSDGESYFEPGELQSNGSQRFDVLAEAVSRHDEDLAEMLRRVWGSTTLHDCPSLDEWNQILNLSKQERSQKNAQKFVEFGDPIDPAIGSPSPPVWTSLEQKPEIGPGGTRPKKDPGDFVRWGFLK